MDKSAAPAARSAGNSPGRSGRPRSPVLGLPDLEDDVLRLLGHPSPLSDIEGGSVVLSLRVPEVYLQMIETCMEGLKYQRRADLLRDLLFWGLRQVLLNLARREAWMHALISKETEFARENDRHRRSAAFLDSFVALQQRLQFLLQEEAWDDLAAALVRSIDSIGRFEDGIWRRKYARRLRELDEVDQAMVQLRRRQHSAVAVLDARLRDLQRWAG